MDEEVSLACNISYNNCAKIDDENNISEPDFNRGCWKSFVDLCWPTEETPVQDGATLSLIIPLLLIASVSIGTNTLVCVVFYLYSQLRLIRHYFVINLAVVDVVIAAVLIPLFVASQLAPENIILCRSQIVLDIACGTASILCLVMISLERYVAVKYSLHYHSIVTQRKAIFGTVFIWTYSAIVSCTAFLSLVRNSNNSKNLLQCFFLSRGYVTFITIASFISPVCVMTFAYWNMFIVARSHARRINSQSTQCDPEGSGHSKQRLKRELKGAKTLTIIMGTHFLCWCPLFVFYLVYTYTSLQVTKTFTVINHVILFLRYCNSLFNPLIYSGINRQFRAGIKRFLLRRNESIEELQTTAATRT